MCVCVRARASPPGDHFPLRSAAKNINNLGIGSVALSIAAIFSRKFRAQCISYQSWGAKTVLIILPGPIYFPWSVTFQLIVGILFLHVSRWPRMDGCGAIWFCVRRRHSHTPALAPLLLLPQRPAPKHSTAVAWYTATRQHPQHKERARAGGNYTRERGSTRTNQKKKKKNKRREE